MDPDLVKRAESQPVELVVKIVSISFMNATQCVPPMSDSCHWMNAKDIPIRQRRVL